MCTYLVLCTAFVGKGICTFVLYQSRLILNSSLLLFKLGLFNRIISSDNFSAELSCTYLLKYMYIGTPSGGFELSSHVHLYIRKDQFIRGHFGCVDFVA